MLPGNCERNSGWIILKISKTRSSYVIFDFFLNIFYIPKIILNFKLHDLRVFVLLFYAQKNFVIKRNINRY